MLNFCFCEQTFQVILETILHIDAFDVMSISLWLMEGNTFVISCKITPGKFYKHKSKWTDFSSSSTLLLCYSASMGP